MIPVVTYHCARLPDGSFNLNCVVAAHLSEPPFFAHGIAATQVDRSSFLRGHNASTIETALVREAWPEEIGGDPLRGRLHVRRVGYP